MRYVIFSTRAKETVGRVETCDGFIVKLDLDLRIKNPPNFQRRAFADFHVWCVKKGFAWVVDKN